MTTSTTAVTLCQVIHCWFWMTSGFLNSHDVRDPLTNVVENRYTGGGEQEKFATSHIALLNVSWRTVPDHVFQNLKETLQISVKLHISKENHTICVFTDTSENFLASSVIQMLNEQSKKSLDERTIEPIVFIGWPFVRSLKLSSTYQNEAYSRVCPFERRE